MSIKLPEEVTNAWKDREGPVVLTTVSKDGMPNAIYASIVNMVENGTIAVVDNYFNKTKQNIDSCSKVSVLFITKGHKSYQVKGSFEYHNRRGVYNEMLSWADPKHPRKGVVIVNAQEVYKGGERLV